MDEKNALPIDISDEELVKEIAALARLDFDEGEVKDYASQMRAILDHFEDLKDIDLEGIDPTVQINPVEIPLEDDCVEKGLSRDKILNLSAKRRGDFISVPRIVNPEDEAGSGA